MRAVVMHARRRRGREGRKSPRCIHNIMMGAIGTQSEYACTRTPGHQGAANALTTHTDN